MKNTNLIEIIAERDKYRKALIKILNTYCESPYDCDCSHGDRLQSIALKALRKNSTFIGDDHG
jgi:hypothetical protein